MKKILVALVAILIAVAAFAQDHSIGLRGGYGVELSYQQTLGGANFIEADLGLVGDSGFYLTGVYDFVIADAIGGASGLKAYAGPGAQVGILANQLCLGVVGQLGIKYDFPSFPLGVSLDWRPSFSLIGFGFGWSNICAGVRFNF